MAVLGRESVTISDVARQAGVSRQTVSNVLNTPERVAPGTAARVRRAIDELGYRPNRVARNLRGRRSHLIGIMIGRTSGLTGLLDRFLHALTEAAGAAGYHVLLFPRTSVAAELATYEDLLRTGTVDGFVLVDVRVRDERPPWFKERDIPFVCFGRPWGHDHAAFPWVDVDGRHGTAAAVDHLVALGHRRVAYLGWPEETGFGDERRAGWREAVRRHGLDERDLDAS
ncbi:MAG: LacI family DNA-binding transcriptional regulator, partial [Thermoactinospora sp.]|nr:LacI family DNA-binding transcriptional regulator [Thermoactinospora sp.]